MLPPENILSDQLLFKRIKVLWDNKTWYTGSVKSIYGNKHYVLYDDISAFKDPYVPEGLTLPKRRPKYRVLVSDFSSTLPKVDSAGGVLFPGSSSADFVR